MWGLLRSISLFLAVIFSLSQVALSQAPTASGITIVPVSDEFKTEPGKIIERTIRIVNPGGNTATLYPRVLDFYTDNEKGQPVFYSPKDRSSRYALSSWVTFSQPFVRVQPGEDQRFQVTITVPNDAEPGGHYGAVLFSTEEPKLDEDTTQIGVVGMVGTLLLANVPGEITQKMILSDFDAPKLLINPPAKLSVLFQNMGNVHQKPKGEIKIRNWSGDTTATLEVNEGEGNVLPESRRRFNNEWKFDWKAFGKYTASLAVTYGSPEQQITATRSFIVVPLWLIAVIVILIMLITGLIARRRINRGKPPVIPNSLPQTPVQAPRKRVIQ